MDRCDGEPADLTYPALPCEKSARLCDQLRVTAVVQTDSGSTVRGSHRTDSHAGDRPTRLTHRLAHFPDDGRGPSPGPGNSVERRAIRSLVTLKPADSASTANSFVRPFNPIIRCTLKDRLTGSRAAQARRTDQIACFLRAATFRVALNCSLTLGTFAIKMEGPESRIRGPLNVNAVVIPMYRPRKATHSSFDGAW